MIRTIYQYCEHCKEETLFKYEDITCKKCGNKSKTYIEPKKK